MSPTKRVARAILCALSALFISVIAKAQPNYLVPLPQKGSAVAPNPIALNNSGQVLYNTGLLTGNTFVPFPANFTPALLCCPSVLNDSGAVVGIITTTGDVAVFSAGTVTDLGLPPWVAPYPAPPWSAGATAISASGEIVGTTTGVQPPFIYSGGAFNSINITGHGLRPGEAPTPVAINNSGQIVLCGPGQGVNVALLLTGEVITDLPPGCPTAINASGQITGYTGGGGSTGHAFIWANGKQTVLAEPTPFTTSEAVWINKGGQIVGSMNNGPTSVPFFYNGVMTDINSLVSTSDPLKSSVTIAWVAEITDSRMLLVVSAQPVVGSSTAYLLQAPWLDVAPGPLTFASQGVGTQSQPQMLTLTNSGTTPLPLDSISIASGATEFSQANACPQSLAAGANCTVSVTFSPSAGGGQDALLNVVTAGATVAVPLSGTTPITITLSATPVSPTVGQAFTITWSTSTGAVCQSSGGSANDGWSATSASGSASVTETQPGTFTYTITCTAGSVSAVQSLNVTVANPPSSGGGGALDLSSLLLLVGLLALYYRTKPT